jgi:hypothetical protein
MFEVGGGGGWWVFQKGYSMTFELGTVHMHIVV